jgi:hypothetical protein
VVFFSNLRLHQASRDENLRIAFTTAEHRLGIPQLLDVSDLDGQHPIDAHSVITYPYLPVTTLVSWSLRCR